MATSSEHSLGFEPSLARIEAIVLELEEGKTGLGESLDRYEEAVQLLRQCYALLENAERRIEMLVGADASGKPLTEPFDDTASAERERQPNAKNRRREAQPGKRTSASPPEFPAAATDSDAVDAPGGLF